MNELEKALAALDGELPEEPNVREWVIWEAESCNELGRRGRVIPYRRFSRAVDYSRLMTTATNKALCERVPLACRRCGAAFHRAKINQLNCGACIAKVRAALKGGAS